MKKLLCLSLTLLLILSLVACGKKEQSAVLRIEKDEQGALLTETLTLHATGDSLDGFSSTVSMDFTSFDLTDEEMRFVSDAAKEQFFSPYAEIDGVTLKAVADGRVISADIDVDMETDALEQLGKRGLVSLSGNAKSGFSFQKTLSALLESGYSRIDS